MIGTKCICGAGLLLCDGVGWSCGTNDCPVAKAQINVGKYATGNPEAGGGGDEFQLSEADTRHPNFFDVAAIRLCGELSELVAALPPMHRYELDDIAFHLRAIQNIIYARKGMQQ